MTTGNQRFVPWSRLSRLFGDGHPTFKRNLYNGYINPYYWVDDHPLLYGNNGSLDPGTFEDVIASYEKLRFFCIAMLVFGGG